MLSKFTKHAQERSQQRSIMPLETELLLMYGEQRYLGDGMNYWVLGKKGMKRLKKDMQKIMQRFDRLKDCFVVDTDEGVVVTVGHEYKRPKIHI